MGLLNEPVPDGAVNRSLGVVSRQGQRGSDEPMSLRVDGSGGECHGAGSVLLG
jgi:hypothetical protein